MKSLLMFILFAAMLCWLMFSPVYRHVLIVRQAVLQKEVDYLLEVGASGGYGYIDSVMIEESRQRLASFGMRPESAIFTVSATNGVNATDPQAPVLRGTGIELTIRYPYEGLFEIDRLIGLAPPPPESTMSAFGLKMSEYVP
jgi:hypothetical protein